MSFLKYEIFLKSYLKINLILQWTEYPYQVFVMINIELVWCTELSFTFLFFVFPSFFSLVQFLKNS